MNDGLADDDLSLPKATVQKLVSEMLPPEITFSRESRDLLIECCVEFVHLISSEANEICEKESKKTIAAEHVIKAIQELGFGEYIEPINVVVEEHKVQAKAREKKISKFEKSGLSTEELLAQQEELLSQARSRFAQQHVPTLAKEETTEASMVKAEDAEEKIDEVMKQEEK